LGGDASSARGGVSNERTNCGDQQGIFIEGETQSQSMYRSAVKKGIKERRVIAPR